MRPEAGSFEPKQKNSRHSDFEQNYANERQFFGRGNEIALLFKSPMARLLDSCWLRLCRPKPFYS